MEKAEEKKTRVFDALAIAILLSLFAKGYLAAMGPGSGDLFPRLELGVLVLASFLGVLYPFRAHMRLAWLIATPVFVSLVPIFGHDIYMRLNRAAGEEDVATSQFSTLLLVYVGFLVCWLLLRRLGLQLAQESNAAIHDHMSLQELMAVIAMFAVLLVLYRGRLVADSMEALEIVNSSTNDRLEFLTITLVFFAIFGGVILALLSRRILWITVWSMPPVIVSITLGWSNYSSHDLFRGSTYFMRRVARCLGFVWALALPLTLTIVACMVARRHGYHVTRRSQVRDDAPEDSTSPPLAEAS